MAPCAAIEDGVRHFVGGIRDPLVHTMETDRARSTVLAHAVVKRGAKPSTRTHKPGAGVRARRQPDFRECVSKLARLLRRESRSGRAVALPVLGTILVLRAIIDKNVSVRRNPRS